MSRAGIRRTDALAQTLVAEGVDAYFACTPVSMGYLHGFHEDAHERLLILAVSAKGEVRMVAPALSAEQARKVGIDDVRPWRDGEDPLQHVFQLADDWDLRSAIIAVDDAMRAQTLLTLQQALPAALFKAGGPILAQRMRRKEPGELDAMRRAARIADEAFVAVAPQIQAGMTERQVDTMLRDAMAERGGVPTFCITATGKNGAEPHHLSDETIIQAGDVLVLDFGCDVEGYKSDITRMVAVGEPSDPDARKVHDIVHRAQAAARAIVRPGVAAGEVDAAARRVIEEAGYGAYFIHRTGHGIGMQGHEEPYIIGGSTHRLEPGECFSVEPGIYLPGRFGVRIENIVTVTEDGVESLNAEPASSLTIV